MQLQRKMLRFCKINLRERKINKDLSVIEDRIELRVLSNQAVKAYTFQHAMQNKRKSAHDRHFI